jgi:hypothetical protein
MYGKSAVHEPLLCCPDRPPLSELPCRLLMFVSLN